MEVMTRSSNFLLPDVADNGPCRLTRWWCLTIASLDSLLCFGIMHNFLFAPMVELIASTMNYLSSCLMSRPLLSETASAFSAQDCTRIPYVGGAEKWGDL